VIKQVLKSKFIGSLVGTGVGDALGAPFEGRGRVGLEEVENTAASLKVLTYTDDTHMAISAAESLVRTGDFDGQDMALAFTENYELEPFRGYGLGPPRIFRLIRAGGAWDRVAQGLYRGGSYGNGSAMRIASIGVFYHDNPQRLRDVAYKSSLITHAHELGKEGTALQAYAIALATSLKPLGGFEQGDFLSKLVDYMPSGVYREKLNRMQVLLGQPDKGRVIEELGNGVEAFNSVPAAIYSFLAWPDSFAQAVLHAISLGGDTDTIGAMTGAISGAYLGVESIPGNWKSRLENVGYIEELGAKLYLRFVGRG
jgi:poly(ADP-ribose) glycohydrolase ARH3